MLPKHEDPLPGIRPLRSCVRACVRAHERSVCPVGEEEILGNFLLLLLLLLLLLTPPRRDRKSEKSEKSRF